MEREVNQNEGRKLTAAWLNVVAAGVIATGAVSHIGPVLLGERTGPALGRTAIATLFCLMLGLTLHAVARVLVRKAD